MVSNCFETCDPSSPGNNMLAQNTPDTTPGDLNLCCLTSSTSSGYGTDTTNCILCKLICIYYNYSSHMQV